MGNVLSVKRAQKNVESSKPADNTSHVERPDTGHLLYTTAKVEHTYNQKIIDDLNVLAEFNYGIGSRELVYYHNSDEVTEFSDII